MKQMKPKVKSDNKSQLMANICQTLPFTISDGSRKFPYIHLHIKLFIDVMLCACVVKGEMLSIKGARTAPISQNQRGLC